MKKWGRRIGSEDHEGSQAYIARLVLMQVTRDWAMRDATRAFILQGNQIERLKIVFRKCLDFIIVYQQEDHQMNLFWIEVHSYLKWLEPPLV